MIINFNKNIYHKKAINRAIKEFKYLANFSIKQTGNYIQVELKNIDKEVSKIIKDEFCNHVLGLMKISKQ